MKSFDTLYNEPRIYAYSLPEVGKLAGWLKVGYTDRQTVDERIRQQLKTPMLGYKIVVNEPAVCGGRFFRDSAVHKILEDRGFKRARFIPIFMHLSDYREKALVDVIRNIESDLFTQVTGLTLADFETLVDFGVFNSAQMNSCIWQFRAYEEESLDYLHIRDGLVEDSPLVGGWDSSVSKKDAYESLMKG